MKKIIPLTLAAILFSSVMAYAVGTRLEYPLFQSFDKNGRFLVGGLLFSYYPGTAIKKPLYTDRDLTVPYPNPIVLNSRGEPFITSPNSLPIYMDGLYKLILRTKPAGLGDNGTEIWSLDWVSGAGGGGGGYESACLYGSNLADILTAVGPTDKKTLALDCTVNVTKNAVVTSNINFVAMVPGKFLCSTSAYTINFQGGFSGDPYHYFYGCGQPTFTEQTMVVYPQWFIDGGSGTEVDPWTGPDNAAGFLYALESGAHRVVAPPGSYSKSVVDETQRKSKTIWT